MIDLKYLEIYLTNNLQSGNFLSQFVCEPGQKPCGEGAFNELFILRGVAFTYLPIRPAISLPYVRLKRTIIFYLNEQVWHFTYELIQQFSFCFYSSLTEPKFKLYPNLKAM
jgi:hypothetical protein